MLGADEEVIAGRRPVEEAFLAHRDAHRLLVVPQRRQALEKLVLHATNLRIPIVEIEGGTLTSLTGFDGHQGIALVTDRRKFGSLDDILARARDRAEPPLVLALDSLEDPQNLGTLLRSAESAGVHGVIFPTRRQAPLSPAAVKASAGAVEHLLLVPVDDLAEALTDLHVRGLRILGSEADAPMTARQADLRGPLTLVVGSEGQGLGPAVRRRCDALVRIPMRGLIASLNAAVAGSVLLYEASSQRGGEAPDALPRETLPEPGVLADTQVAAAAEGEAAAPEGDASAAEGEPAAPVGEAGSVAEGEARPAAPSPRREKRKPKGARTEPRPANVEPQAAQEENAGPDPGQPESPAPSVETGASEPDRPDQAEPSAVSRPAEVDVDRATAEPAADPDRPDKDLLPGGPTVE